MSNRRNGPVKRAAIRLLAEERRLPLAAAAHKYALMPAGAKAALCARIVRQNGNSTSAASRDQA